MFMRPDLEAVPIGRALTNLEHLNKNEPSNPTWLYALARVHSMAYATNLTVIPWDKRDHTPYFGYGSDSGAPIYTSYPDWHQIGDPRDYFAKRIPSDKTNALNHLSNAITYFQMASKAVSESTNAEERRWITLPIHLGLAWTLDQAGRKQEAIVAYRRALQLAWKAEIEPDITLKEQITWSWDQLRAKHNPLAHLPHISIGPGVCFSEEIIGYLKKLLHPVKDAKEIAQLNADEKSLNSMGRAVTPILVPLNPHATFAELVNSNANVEFDLDGSGLPRRWGWITTNAAWLVYDHMGTRRITSGLQMFGNVTFWIFWRDGFEALSSLDDNGDGVLSGSELDGLCLWWDRNGNGISDPGEVRPVTDFGIKSIDCRRQTAPNGMPFNPHGVTFRDGSTRATYDWNAPCLSN